MAGTGGRLLLALQFYPGDREQALRLARLIADLEPGVSPYADFLFYARFDCEHSEDTVEYLRPKFQQVFTGRSVNRRNGWPAGPNAMAADLFRLVADKYHSYGGIMMLESDCVPLRRTWVQELHAEWMGGKQLVLGDWVGSGTDWRHSHVNGNMIFSPLLLKRWPEMTRKIAGVGWDAWWWKYYWKSARASRLIYSDYRRGTKKHPLGADGNLWHDYFHRGYPTNPLADIALQPAWLHGLKVDCTGIVRRRLS